MDRNLGAWVQEHLGDYRELVESGITGARSAFSADSDLSVGRMAEEARDQWRIASTAALAGTVIAIMADERKRPSSGLVGFALGGLIGLLTAVAWGRRELIGAAAEGAVEEIGRTRNAQWLERHPIDYA